MLNITETVSAVKEKFNFSRFMGGTSQRPFKSLGLTSEQVQCLLDDRYGICELLMEEFPDITKRGSGEGAQPLSFMKAGIVFEDQGRDTTYDAIGEAMGCTDTSAYQYMLKFRDAVRAAYGLEIVTTKDSVKLIDQQHTRDAAERVVAVFEQHVRPAVKKLDACVASMEKANMPVILPAKEAALLTAYRSDACEEVADV